MASSKNGSAKIQTKPTEEVCHDDSVAPVKAETVDELHSFQKKKSAPNSPITGAEGAFSAMSEEKLHKQQLQSISAFLASLVRKTGQKLVKGDPTSKKIGDTPKVAHVAEHHVAPNFGTSDSALKLIHILYNLSPGELYEQAIKYDHGSFVTSNGALATLCGAKTGRSPRDKRVVTDTNNYIVAVIEQF